MLLSTSMSGTGNLGNLKNHIDQIKKQTGSQDLTQALEASTKSRAVTKGRVSQTEYIQAYAALEAQGLDEETISRIINKVSAQKGDFIENLNKTNLSRYGKDAQERVRLSKANLGLEKLNDEAVEKTSAEKIQEKMRELNLKKDELLIKILPIAEKLLSAIKPAIFDKLINVVVKLANAITPALENLLTVLEPLIDAVMPVIDDLLTPLLKWYSGIQKKLIENVLKPVLEWLKTTGVPALIQIFQAIPHLPQILLDGIKWWWEKIKNFPSAIGTKVSEAWESLKSWAIEKWNAIKKWVDDKWTLIKNKFTEFKNTIINIPSEIGNKIANFLSPFTPDDDTVKPIITGAAAQGGIVNSPSICGEAGPELVLPLDNSRSGRASQIINNFNTNQNFNMTNNQTTPLAFAQAVGMNKFVRRSVI